MKIAILFDHLGPYHIARLSAVLRFFNLLAVEFGNSSDEYAWDSPDPNTLRRSIINVHGTAASMPLKQFRRKLESTLLDFRPNIIAIPGWSCRGSFIAMAWATKHRVPIVIMSDSAEWDEPRVEWKEWIKRRIVRLAGSALVAGTSHGAYMRQLNMLSEQIFFGYDVVDNNYFTNLSRRWQACDGYGVGKYFLASSRFIPKKNLFRLLDAYAYYATPFQGEYRDLALWNLCLLGDGALRPKLLAHCAALGLSVFECCPWEADALISSTNRRGSVFLPGFKQIEDLPRFYAHAGAFVHASTTEQWGLVVNEAMASGLTVLVSNRCGCAGDLVQDGVNGFSFDPFDTELLGRLLTFVSGRDFPLAEFGIASKKIIDDWGPDRFADGLRNAVACAFKSSPRIPSLIDHLILEALIRR